MSDATLWPPLGREETVPLRGTASALRMVLTGNVPIGVQPTMQRLHLRATGTVRQVDVIHVLVATRTGVYLVPMYRFRGDVRFPGVAGRHTWVALVLAAEAG